MQKILVLGAGKSAPYLIEYLLNNSEAFDWQVTVGDLDLAAAKDRVANHPRGRAVEMDIFNETQVKEEFANADIVVSMLAPAFQYRIAADCLESGSHMVSVSYTDKRTAALDELAREKGLIFLNEMGLDPGIDHMSASKMLDDIRSEGGRITAYRSYGSGVPARDSIDNPLQYVITWNPQNVAMAGMSGAIYRYNNAAKVVPAHRVFYHTWNVDVDGVGRMEAYPNRDSLEYLKTFKLEHVDTMIRATLRYPGYSETWAQVVALGLNNKTVTIPNLQDYTYREVLEMFLPLADNRRNVEHRAAKLLGVSPTGLIMENLRWLGLFSNDKITCEGDTAADMLTDLLLRKLPLTGEAKDMVILLHEMDVVYQESGRRTKRISTMVHEGDKGGTTAMARTVGMPAGIVVKLILQNAIKERGCLIPDLKSIYEPGLKELAASGIKFVDKEIELED
jgi:saccharopine dehydrogenase-like NADP-dependent oxidoreductase